MFIVGLMHSNEWKYRLKIMQRVNKVFLYAVYNAQNTRSVFPIYCVCVFKIKKKITTLSVSSRQPVKSHCIVVICWNNMQFTAEQFDHNKV